MNEILIEEPGFLTTVQDLGRPGHAAAGVSASGAADPIALKIGNRLAGNEPGDAALEMTILGGAFRFAADAVCALTGAWEGSKRVGVAPHITVGGMRPSSWCRTMSWNCSKCSSPRITMKARASSGCSRSWSVA